MTRDGITTALGSYDRGYPQLRVEAQERSLHYSYDARFRGRPQSISQESVAAGSSRVTEYQSQASPHFSP